MAGGGIPGLRGGDHVGITVPDLAQAHEFLPGGLRRAPAGT